MNKKYIAIGVIVLVVGYFVWKYFNSGTVVPPVTPGGTSIPPGTSNEPGSSLPNPVSVPHVVSQQQGMGVNTPVTITEPVVSFIPGVTNAEAVNNVAPVGSSTDLSSYPGGFVTWINSLGPQNKNYAITLLGQFAPDEIALVDKIVTQNLWGNPSVAGDWNNFVAKYGFPQAGGFSSYGSPNKSRSSIYR